MEGATEGCHPGDAGGTGGCCLPLILGSEQADSTGIKEKPRGWGPGRPGSSSSHLAPMEMKRPGQMPVFTRPVKEVMQVLGGGPVNPSFPAAYTVPVSPSSLEAAA